MTQALDFTPLADAFIPEEYWEVHDDLCDCTFQRIGFWTNPYMGETMRIRLCCVWKEMEKQWPQFFQHTHAFWDYNKEEWVPGAAEWNGEDQMERAVWYRQRANIERLPLEAIRDKYRLAEPPAGTPRPKEEPVTTNGQQAILAPPPDIYAAYGDLYVRYHQTKQALDAMIQVISQVKQGELSLEDIHISSEGEEDGSNTDA